MAGAPRANNISDGWLQHAKRLKLPLRFGPGMLDGAVACGLWRLRDAGSVRRLIERIDVPVPVGRPPAQPAIGQNIEVDRPGDLPVRQISRMNALGGRI
jgi:hypothetical protein